jgi:hypothetical protein
MRMTTQHEGMAEQEKKKGKVRQKREERRIKRVKEI